MVRFWARAIEGHAATAAQKAVRNLRRFILCAPLKIANGIEWNAI
jgi:hypothetical protein